MWNLAGRALGGLFKLGKWGIIGGTAVAGGAALVGSTDAGGSFLKRTATAPVEGAAEIAANGGVQQTKSTMWGMLGFLAEILKAFGVKGGIPETLMGIANRGNAIGGGNPIQNADRWAADDARFGASGPGVAASGANGNGGGGTDNDGGGSGWGTTALATLGGGATLVGGAWGVKRLMAARTPGLSGAAGGADDAIKIMQGAQVGDDIARGASRFGRWGKVAAIGATVIGGGMALFGGSPAEAATLTNGAVAAGGSLTANANNNGSISTTGADIAGMGLSIVGSKAAAQGLATVAAPALASLGVKAIPGIASIYAAGEGIYNTASYALKGEWGKAGLSLVSGIGETVAGLGGAATYLTVGTAWREAVRYGGAKLLGEENTIEHSTVVSVGSYLKDAFFGATTNTDNAPAPQRLAPRANGPVLAF